MYRNWLLHVVKKSQQANSDQLFEHCYYDVKIPFPIPTKTTNIHLMCSQKKIARRTRKAETILLICLRHCFWQLLENL